jgi:hypothetical protein
MRDASNSPDRQAETPDAGASTQIASDLGCVACDYNLRGLNPLSRCPECGQSIAESMHPALMRFAHPAWLQRVARGAGILAAAMVMGTFTNVAWWIEDELQVAYVAGLINTIPWIMLMLVLPGVGVWMLTAPEPGTLRTEQLTLREALRWTMMLVIVGNIASFLIPVSQSYALHLVRTWALIALSLLELPLFYFYIAQLASRLPDPFIQRWCHRLVWLDTASLASWQVLPLLVDRGILVERMQWLGVIGWWLGQPIALWVALLAWRLRRRLAAAARTRATT